MPFVIKDVLQHKRNDRQIREIHEREYRRYLSELRQQPIQQSKNHPFYLSPHHIAEVERSRLRNEKAKESQYRRIERENTVLYDRLVKAGQRTLIDTRNNMYEQNSQIFRTKHFQQRVIQYKKINNENQILLQRIHSARGRLMSKDQCDRDWKKSIDVMKKTSDYPENIDRFVAKNSTHQEKQLCPLMRMKTNVFSAKPLTFLLDEC